MIYGIYELLGMLFLTTSNSRIKHGMGFVTIACLSNTSIKCIFKLRCHRHSTPETT